MGDATNLVTAFAGELLSQAADLVAMGLHPSEVVSGYSKASKLAQTILPGTISHRGIHNS